MNTPKWIPKHSAETLELFVEARQLERDLRVLGAKFATNVNLNQPDYYEFGQLLGHSRVRFEHSEQLQTRLAKLAARSTDQRIERSPYKVLQSRRARLCRQMLKRRHWQLLFVLQRMIRQMLDSGSESGIDGALVLCTLHNSSIRPATRSGSSRTSVGGAQVCSNTFPGLMLPPKRFDLNAILQAVTKQRSELCCTSLIVCLLATCAPDLEAGGGGGGGIGGGDGPNDDTSDTSSVEVLKALTVHMTSSPAGRPTATATSSSAGHCRRRSQQFGTFAKQTMATLSPADAGDDATIDFFDKLVVSSSVIANGVIVGDPTPPTPTAAPSTGGNDLLHQLVANEENYVANVLLKCLKLCPSAFVVASARSDNDDKKPSPPSKADIIRWVTRGTRSLWTQVSSQLEHVVLWWSHAPIACQPVASARHLRDWLLQLRPADAPEPVLSTLRSLGETLTVHVTAAQWDRQFRLTLVAGAQPVQHVWPAGSEFAGGGGGGNTNETLGTTTGRLWSELLHSLTAFCNSCDCNGTIPNELPIVEQIPVLHRLDHSIHTMRLWSLAQATALCNDWNMATFFRVVHTDVAACLRQLDTLRAPELVAVDAAEVLVQVCVTLRAKLVSEIRVNVAKLKRTYDECIDVLATVCRTISLATLSLCFPSPVDWRGECVQTGAHHYVGYYLNQIYLPVVRATQLLDILGLMLKIMCESWLDHIYVKRIRFSRCGAQNLQRDFDGVAAWIEACADVLPEHRLALAQHEVLRMCEGVAKILLRKPDDVISMMAVHQHGQHHKKKHGNDDDCERLRQRSIGKATDSGDEAAQLPPEMFVPNQQRWLELRARDRSLIGCLMCACVAGKSAGNGTGDSDEYGDK